MHDLFETDYDVMVATSWEADVISAEDQTTPEQQQSVQKCIGRVCINCDERYLYS